jgi:hypothetical protein
MPKLSCNTVIVYCIDNETSGEERWGASQNIAGGVKILLGPSAEGNWAAAIIRPG